MFLCFYCWFSTSLVHWFSCIFNIFQKFMSSLFWTSYRYLGRVSKIEKINELIPVFDLTGRLFVIHNEDLNFHDWNLWYSDAFHDKIERYQSIDLSVDLWHLNNMNFILTLWSLNYVVCIPFFCINQGN